MVFDPYVINYKPALISLIFQQGKGGIIMLILRKGITSNIWSKLLKVI